MPSGPRRVGMVGVFIHKILQVPCVAVSCRSALPALQYIFQVRHGSGRKLHPSSVFLYLLPPVLPVIRSCSAARAAASSSCRVIHPLRIRHGRNLPVFSCWLLHHPSSCRLASSALRSSCQRKYWCAAPPAHKQKQSSASLRRFCCPTVFFLPSTHFSTCSSAVSCCASVRSKYPGYSGSERHREAVHPLPASVWSGYKSALSRYPYRFR